MDVHAAGKDVQQGRHAPQLHWLWEVHDEEARGGQLVPQGQNVPRHILQNDALGVLATRRPGPASPHQLIRAVHPKLSGATGTCVRHGTWVQPKVTGEGTHALSTAPTSACYECRRYPRQALVKHTGGCSTQGEKITLFAHNGHQTRRQLELAAPRYPPAQAQALALLVLRTTTSVLPPWVN